MADKIKNPSNKVDRSADGTFHAFWHGAGGVSERSGQALQNRR